MIQHPLADDELLLLRLERLFLQRASLRHGSAVATTLSQIYDCSQAAAHSLHYFGDIIQNSSLTVLQSPFESELSSSELDVDVEAAQTTTTESRILAHTLLSPTAKQFPHDTGYIKRFLRLIIDSSPTPPSDLVMDLYMAHFTSYNMDESHSTSVYSSVNCHRSFFIPPIGKYITLREETSKISSGTTGLRTWPAALHLIKHLYTSYSYLSTLSNVSSLSLSSQQAANPLINLKNKRVLELGCGTGIVGIAASALNTAQSVVLTDGNMQVVEAARENVGLNVMSEFGTKVEVKVLEWEYVDCLNYKSKENEDKKDEEDQSWLKNIDIILASDVVYDPSIIQPFVKVLKTVLEAPRAASDCQKREAWISLTLRSPETYQLFENALQESGLDAIAYQSAWTLDDAANESGGGSHFCYDESAASFVVLRIASRFV